MRYRWCVYIRERYALRCYGLARYGSQLIQSVGFRGMIGTPDDGLLTVTSMIGGDDDGRDADDGGGEYDTRGAEYDGDRC